MQFLGLNDLGQACGWQAKCGGAGDGDPLPIVWTPELGVVLLPLPEGATYGKANDINNVAGLDGIGQTVCTLAFPALAAERAYLYDDGNWIDLGILPGATHARPAEINDFAEVVGECEFPFKVHPARAFLWFGGNMSPIDSRPGPEDSASCINEFSSIAGWSGESFVENEGFILSSGRFNTIPLLPTAASSEPTGINAFDVVTGQARIPVKSGPIGFRSWIYSHGNLTDLDPFPDMLRCHANAINDARQIVGKCTVTTGGGPDFLWQDGEAYDLDELFEIPPGIPGIAKATAINNRGQIAGWTSGTTAPESRGVILTPIDRPLGDVDINCKVDAWDLALLLGNWGSCPEVGSCMMDFVSSETFQPPPDGVVDAADLAVVLGNWTGQASSLPRRN